MPVVRAHGVRLDRVRFPAARLSEAEEEHKQKPSNSDGFCLSPFLIGQVLQYFCGSPFGES